jgi:hypothetical protein
VVDSILLLNNSSKMEVPFAVILAALAVGMFAIAALACFEALRNSALLCVSVLLGLALLETSLYFAGKSQIILTRTVPETWRQNVIGLGSFPTPKTTIEFREFLDGRMIGNVTYRIDGNGLREIPRAIQGRPYKVAFFGCSFMFGHEVENDQTLPYYFVRNSRGSFDGFNFAGEGWGPHQMLREVETGFVRRVAGTPDLAIYEAIPDHLRRVAGRAPWEDGPKYKLCPGGNACYSGSFHSAYDNELRRWLNKSWTVKFLEDRFASLSRSSDIPLYLAVLERTRTLLARNGTRFVVVLWDQNELARTIMKALRANHFDVIALSSIVSEYNLGKRPLTQLDRHPLPATNEAIANYLWKQVGERLLADLPLEKPIPVGPGNIVALHRNPIRDDALAEVW